ncbi:MAG: peptidase C14, partial [Sulfurimonas sp.]|nr:peptidase C14 [Sulfurimonas sp.]
KGVAATRIKPKSIEFDKSKMVVLSAGKDTQYSSAYPQKAHRMFSYFLMEELLGGERDVQNLYGKVYKKTKETTRENYGDMRLQEPTLDGNEKIEL